MKFPARVRKVRISPQIMTSLFTQGREFNAEVVEGLPAESALVHIEYNHLSDEIGMFFVHESFEIVDNPLRVPVQAVVFSALARVENAT